MTNIVRIGDVAEIFDGPHATPKKTSEGPYFLSISSLSQGRLDLSKSARLSQEQFLKWTKRVTPKEGDVLFSYETRLGEAALMPSGVTACLGRRMGLLRPKLDKVLPEYLLYAYLSPFFQQTIKANTIVGATVNRIALTELIDFPIRIPPLSEQKEACELLKALDQKIELNNKINSELEAMAKTLYDYWFVQFDFPDKNGKPYKSSGGKMVYNEQLKREIPEGWEVKTLLDIAEIKKGTLVTEKTADLNGKFKVVSAGLKYSYKHSVSNRNSNTITISASGANAGFINFWREPIFACDCTTVRGKSDIETLFFLHFIKLHQEYIFQQARGSAQPHVYPEDIQKLKISIPDGNLLETFGNYCVTWNNKITVIEQENENLISLRDFLLPMLMNGQVKVT